MSGSSAEIAAPRSFRALEPFYALAPYHEEYGDLIEGQRDASAALLELFLFRQWLAWHAWRRRHPGEAETVSLQAAADGLSGFARRHGIDLQAALASDAATLVAERLRMYEDFRKLERSCPDLESFQMVALVLIRQLSQPLSTQLLDRLTAMAELHYATALQACWPD